MSDERKELRYKSRLFSLKKYIIYFLMISFALTCSLLLFLNHLHVDYGTIKDSGPLTFFNVVLLSLIVTIVDGIYNKIAIEYPVRRILQASQKLINGDFSVRLAPLHGYDSTTELDILTENFNLMAEELSSVEMLRNDFVSNVSHELKTPLSIIQNNADLLQSSELGEQERRECAKTIANASRRLTGLITNILRLNKLENQQIFPELKDYSLDNQLAECIMNMDDALERKNIELEVDLEERVKVRQDEELLGIVWNNLLSNALKFTDPGGTISVSMKTDGNAAFVRIADTGCGMSPEVGKHIFEKFYQGDTSHATQGNGLGLALAKKVIDIAGGDITVESELGKGTVFTVKLKRIVSDKEMKDIEHGR